MIIYFLNNHLFTFFFLLFALLKLKHMTFKLCILQFIIKKMSICTLMFESRSGRGVHHYVIKLVSDLRQISGFLRVLRFTPPIKLTATI